MKHLLMVLALSFAPSIAAAQVETVSKIRAATLAWEQAHQVVRFKIALVYDGRAVDSIHASTDRAEMASLSKAITGVCAGTLLDDGIWNLHTTSADVLGYGPQGITVTLLLTHSGGIGPDSTQGKGLLNPERWPGTAPVTQTSLARPRKNIGTYAYSNENYAILGALIEAQLGVPYRQACEARALAPAGVHAARPSRLMGSTLPWGGWFMRPAEYAQFHHHWFGPQWRYGRQDWRARGWQGDWPSVPIGQIVRCSMGVFQRPVEGGMNFWHFGIWCTPLRINRGSYAASFQGGWTVVITYDACLDVEDMLALDTAISAAAAAG